MAEETYWALHAFQAENEDELTFEPGEPIVILEKDDQYGDGWWQGRNMRGEVGLFPKDYTTSTRPIMPSDSPIKSPTDDASHGAAMTGGTHGPLAATMTDVQNAIEQQPQMHNGVPSAASSPTRSTSRRDTLGEEDAQSPGFMPANARSILAANAKSHLDAQREEEEARRLGEQRYGSGDTAPPIADLELSDESDDDEEAEQEYTGRKSLGGASRSTYEQSTPRPPFVGDDDEEEEPLSRLVIPDESPARLRSAAFYGSPEPDPMEEAQIPLPSTPQDLAGQRTSAAARQASTSSIRSAGQRSYDEKLDAPSSMPSRFSAATATSMGTSERQSTRRSSSNSLGPVVPAPAGPRSITQTSPTVNSGFPVEADPEQRVETLTTRTPVVESAPTFQPTTPLSMASTSSRPQSRSGPGSTSATTADQEQSPRSSLGAKPSIATMSSSPETWTVEQVVEWGKSRGFDALTLSKFQEHEISGDVLLELDVATLKEIDLPAFGRRVQIYNAIKELKKSLEPPATLPAPVAQQPILSPTFSGYEPDTPSSRNFSPRDSFSPQETRNSFGTAISNDRRMSDMSSVGGAASTRYNGGGLAQSQTAASSLAASLPYPVVTGYTSQRSHARHGSDPVGSDGGAMRGLGFEEPTGSTDMGRSRSAGYDQVAGQEKPTMPAFRHQDSVNSMIESFHSADQTLENVTEEGGDSIDPLASESTAAERKKSKLRRRNDSNASLSSSKIDKDAADVKSPSAPSSPEVSRFGSIRGSKGERASSFFAASLRGRKPAPRAPSATSESDKENKTKRSTRLFTFGSSPTPTQSATMGEKDTKSLISSPLEAGPSTLGKSSASPSLAASVGPKSAPSSPASKSTSRPVSTGPTAGKGAGIGSAVAAPNEGHEDILKKIGTPELTGWLRKKSERYNVWKTRYMILKGRHLYATKSASETRVKGWIDLAGYKVLPDPDSARGWYGFKLHHSSKPPHYFSSDDPIVIRKWMKALMKSSITRDFNAPVLSSNNIQTITLAEAQAMFPPPRPPSPNSRARAQRLRLADTNPNTLSPKDAEILMSLQKPGVPIAPPRSGQRSKRDSKVPSMLSFASSGNGDTTPGLDSPSGMFPASRSPPTSPSSKRRLSSSQGRRPSTPPPVLPPVASVASPKQDPDADLMDWVNHQLPAGTPRAVDFTTSWKSGQLILRLAEVLSGQTKPSLDDAKFASIRPDSDEELDVGFDVYDFLTLDLGIDTGDVSLGELMRGERQQIIKLIEAVRQKYGA